MKVASQGSRSNADRLPGQADVVPNLIDISRPLDPQPVPEPAYKRCPSRWHSHPPGHYPLFRYPLQTLELSGDSVEAVRLYLNARFGHGATSRSNPRDSRLCLETLVVGGPECLLRARMG
jgi:hypothetical protein